MKQLILSLAALTVSASVAFADPAAGTWRTAEGEEGGHLHVAIAPCGAKICGTIKRAIDINGAPSPSYEHLGKRLIWGMVPGDDGRYSDGKVWAPDNGKTYGAKMALKGNKLVVKGCVAGGLICRGQTWTRIK